MTTVDRTNVEAGPVRIGLAFLIALAAVFFALGWVVGKAWVVLAWTVAALKAGWLEALKPGNRKRGA